MRDIFVTPQRNGISNAQRENDLNDSEPYIIGADEMIHTKKSDCQYHFMDTQQHKSVSTIEI
jgi:hypothetical protein